MKRGSAKAGGGEAQWDGTWSLTGACARLCVTGYLPCLALLTLLRLLLLRPSLARSLIADVKKLVADPKTLTDDALSNILRDYNTEHMTAAALPGTTTTTTAQRRACSRRANEQQQHRSMATTRAPLSTPPCDANGCAGCAACVCVIGGAGNMVVSKFGQVRFVSANTLGGLTLSEGGACAP